MEYILMNDEELKKEMERLSNEFDKNKNTITECYNKLSELSDNYEKINKILKDRENK